MKMRMKFLFMFAAMSAMSALAYAQSPVGSWAGERQSMSGEGAADIPVTLVLNADGTGVFNPGRQGGNDNEVEELMIQGNKVTFNVTISGGPPGAGNITASFEGEVDGDTLTLNLVSSEGGRGGRENPFVVLTRQ